MSLDEAATRKQRIDVQLARAGWSTQGIDFESEYEVGSLGDADHGFTDYLLTDDVGAPLAVVEAKRSSRDAIVGKEQARLYAEAISLRTGFRPVVFLANGDEIWYWDHVSNARLVGSFFTREELGRRRYQLHNRQPLHSIPINTSIVDRPYQHEAIRRAHEAFTSGRRRALWVMATGTGKTRVGAALVDSLLTAQWIERVLFITDRKELRDQAHRAFEAYLPDEPAVRIQSGAFDGAKRLYTATVQTLQSCYQDIGSGFFDLVISDESHRSIYDKWEAVISYFDALLLGLTATPADYLARNTFLFFGCADNVPTFAYEYDQAVIEGYLVPFRAHHAQTRFQIEGIHGAELPEPAQQQLRAEGLDPSDIDFSGTELERKVTNRDTLRLQATEIFESAYAEPDGNLPGKTIIFALSHKHAKRLWEVFSELYEQFPGIAEVIDSYMERPQSLINRFRDESMPRIAISVDMLDTGIDVPTVTNLIFLKPVFSRIKFWQMVGRGTRLVETPDAVRAWCPKGSKTSFRILDFFGNFERFQLNPEGIEPATSVAASVRLFRMLLRFADAAGNAGREGLRDDAIRELRSMIAALPRESGGVRENRPLLNTVTRDAYWSNLDATKRRELTLAVAPLMRYLPDTDVASVSFSARCIEFATASLTGDQVLTATVARSLHETLLRLDPTHPRLVAVAREIQQAQTPAWPTELTIDIALRLRTDLAHLVRFAEPEAVNVIKLDIADSIAERHVIFVGPDDKEFNAEEYRAQVEKSIRQLVDSTPALSKLSAGAPLTDDDLAEVETVLNRPDLFVTQGSLRAAYRAPNASLEQLLRYVLGIEHLPGREDMIRSAFEAFVMDKAYLRAGQILFVRVFAQRLIQAGRVQRGDIFVEPFVRIASDPSAVLPDGDLEELFALSSPYEAA